MGSFRVKTSQVLRIKYVSISKDFEKLPPRLDVRKLSVENEALVLKCNFNFMVLSIVFLTCVKDH